MDNIFSTALATLKTVRERYPFSANHCYYKKFHRRFFCITQNIESSYLARFYSRKDYVSLELFKRILKIDTVSVQCDRLSYLGLLILLKNQEKTGGKYLVKFLEIVEPAHVFLCLFPYSDDVIKNISNINKITPKEIIENEAFEGAVLLDIWVNSCFVVSVENVQKWLIQLKQYDNEESYSVYMQILIDNQRALNHQNRLDKGFYKDRKLKKLYKEFCILNAKINDTSHFEPVENIKKKYKRYLIMKGLFNPFSGIFYLISFMMIVTLLAKYVANA